MQYGKLTLFQQKMALATGCSLIAMALIAGVGYGYAFQSFYVAGNSAKTLQRLNNVGPMLQIVIISFLVISILDIVVACTLYKLFSPFNQKGSEITIWLRIVYSVILTISIYFLFEAWSFSKSNPQNEFLLADALDSFLQIWSFGLIFFGIHLVSLGFVLKRSLIVPVSIYLFAIFAGVCYTLIHLAKNCFPSYQNALEYSELILSLPMALGELLLAVWLIRMGVQRSTVIKPMLTR